MPVLRRSRSGEPQPHMEERRDSNSRPAPVRDRTNSGGGGGAHTFSVPLLSRFNVGTKSDGSRGKEKRSKKPQQPARQPPSLARVSVEVLSQWESSFESLLQNPDGMELFEDFLKSEFSEENIQFWKACEKYKTVPEETLLKEADAIFAEFISQCAPKLVNIDHQTTKGITENMKSPDHDTFLKAQQSIYLLMARDSYVRFVKSEPFQIALKR